MPLGDRNVFGQTVRQHADVVDDDIDPTEPLQCRAPNAAERIRIRDVGALGQYDGATFAQLVGEGLDTVIVEVDGHYMGAPAGERARDGAAYAAGRSGDDGDLVAKSVHCGNSLSTMRGIWKWIGLAGVAGVVAGGVLVARDQRKRRAYTPDEVRSRLHQRLAEYDGESFQSKSGSGSGSTANKR